MCDDDQSVDVAEGQETELDLGLDSEVSSVDALVCAILHDIGDDVSVGDHDGFLAFFSMNSRRRRGETNWQTGGARGIAKIGGLASSLASEPHHGLQVRHRPGQLDQIIDCLEARLLGVLGEIHEEDLVVGDSCCLGRFEGRLEDRHACEEGFGSRGLELVLQLLGRVGNIRRCRNAIYAVYGEQHRHVVNLLQRQWSFTDVIPFSARFPYPLSFHQRLTVLKEKTPTTLSHGESTLGCHPMTLERALATLSERRWASTVVKVLPVMPQVKGLRLLAILRRPWTSLLMKSPTEMESGGSVGLSAVVSLSRFHGIDETTYQRAAWEPMAEDKRPCFLGFFTKAASALQGRQQSWRVDDRLGRQGRCRCR